MSWTDYPALGERCYLLTLPNGLCRARAPEAGLRRRNSRFSALNFGSDDV